MKKVTGILALIVLCVMELSAQISVKGYSLVYSSETPERAASLLNLSDEELANCTGDFMSTENFERNWLYCPRATSKWNKRMAENDEDRAKVHLCDNGMLRMLALSLDGTASGCITSGIKMKQGYKYGIFEIKAKCNAHKSNFPAVWMMPSTPHGGWPNCGEIDIMEQIGTSTTVYSTVHLGARYDQKVGKSYSWSGSYGAGGGWHIYSLRWDKTSLIFYCDGRQVFRYNKDASLDLESHPEYEHAQFPYNEEFYIILDQALGCNAWWGDEDPDPSYTYEMDVEYVRIWQTPETYDIDKWYVLSNYSDPTRYMMVDEDNTLTTSEVTDPAKITGNMIFTLIPTDSGGQYAIKPFSGNWVGYMADANKPVPLSVTPSPYYMLKDATKGVAFDYNKNVASLTYAEGSRALCMNSNRNYTVTTSGTTRDGSWWILQDATSIATGIDPTQQGSNLQYVVPRKIVRNGQLLIRADNKEYSIVGTRIR